MQIWSTDSVPIEQRLDYFAAALSSAVDPMRVASCGSLNFEAHIRSIDMGPVVLIHAKGSEHRCVRGVEDISRSSARNFHLVTNLLSPWDLNHRGRVRLQPGDVVLLDPQFTHEIVLPAFEIVHIKIPEAWLRGWIPNPSVLAGRVIPRESRWGAPLCAYMAQLCPDLVLRRPMPAGLLADQVGALLALIASELAKPAGATGAFGVEVQARIQECIQQRCCEATLVASDVAQELNISTRTLHRAIATSGMTFGGMLLKARVDVAFGMLDSPIHRRLTTSEIGRRSGFSDASHFSRSFRRAFGISPSAVRSRRVEYVDSRLSG